MSKIRIAYKTIAYKEVELPNESLLDNEDELFEFAQKTIGWGNYLSAIYDENGDCLGEGFEE